MYAKKGMPSQRTKKSNLNRLGIIEKLAPRTGRCTNIKSNNSHILQPKTTPNQHTKQESRDWIIIGKKQKYFNLKACFWKTACE
jgi:hypothetical protein